MLENLAGGYSFVPGTDYLSFAVVAKQGFSIERAVLREPQQVENTLAVVEAHLKSVGRPLAALCGMEFRQYLERQPPYEEFAAFNANYIRNLTAAQLTVSDRIPVARTNVVSSIFPNRKGAFLYAFSYTVEGGSGARHFVTAAIPEVRFKPSGPEIVEAGQTSTEALERKLDYILDTAGRILTELGVSYEDVTGSQLYCEADLHRWLAPKIIPALGKGGLHGVQWHHSLPPASPAIMELDVRSVRADLILG